MKKIIWISLIVVFVVLSQIFLVRMVYANKLNDLFSSTLAKAYNLKAGEIKNDDGDIDIYLKDYFEHKFFLEKFIEKQIAGGIDGQPLINQKPEEKELKEIVWQKIIKDAWLKKIARENSIKISDEDLNFYLESIGGEEALKSDIDQYGLPYSKYKRLVIDYYILESKVHEYLLDTYADIRGAQKAQEAYAMLEAEGGKNFDEVAISYADIINYAQNSVFLKEEDLVDAYEPIRELSVGGFSKIVQVPTGYLIWKLDDVIEDGGEKIWQVRAIFITAQTIDGFLDEYLSKSTIEKKY